MPSTRRTVNDLGGSMVEDPMDRIESDNRNANMQASQFNYGAQQNSAMTALALARLKQSDYQFGQGRADQMAVFREGLAAQNHQADLNAGMHREDLAQGAAFHGDDVSYRDRRDATNEGHYQDTLDPEKNPSLKQSIITNAALQRLLDREAKGDVRTDKAVERQDKAADSVPAPEFRDDFERQTYTANIAAGQTPAQAALGVTANRRDHARGAVDSLKAGYGASLDDAGSGSLPFIRDIADMTNHDGKSNMAAMGKRRDLEAAMKDAGMTPQEIQAGLQEIELKHKPGWFPTKNVQALYAQLGY